MTDTREFIILGSGTSHGVPMIGCHCEVCESKNPRNNRTRTGALVQTAEGNLLIDTPPELRIQLIRERIDRVHATLFTHSHADHLFGLDDLRLFGYYLQRPVPLLCEENVEQQIRTSYGYAFTDPWPNAHPGAIPMLEFSRISTSPFEVLGQPVQPIRLWHGKLPVLGFRFNDLAFCTDVSSIPDESWPLLEGLDTLIIDALREKPHPTHFSVDQALEVIGRVKPRRAYLTHISHTLEHDATNARLPLGVELAYDGLRIPY
ncbi:MAG TPA: MBL fold metallo-hydrolase [Planctomycetaceae bacterium]|nr:MBL fold metallo-hydrolase [Planctomycetaceae bacterium]